MPESIMTPLSRFDSLVHVTRDGRWTNGRHDASYDRLIAELDRGAVARACLVGLAGVVDNEYVLDCAAASGGRLVPIAGLDPTASTEVGKLPAVIRGLARAGFSGFKLHPRLNGFDPLDARALAAIRAAASEDLVVFLDTLFRQPSRASKHAADTIDAIAHACPTTTIVLLHGGGPAVLEVAEVVRVRPSLILDLSFTMLHYRGSSLDDDLRWLMERLDQRIVIGSDMPEFTPSEAFNRAAQLAAGLAPEKWANIACRNLEHLFPVPTAATNA